MPGLKIIAVALALLIALPVRAEEAPDLGLPKGLDQALRDMMDQLKPALTEMFKMLNQLEGIDDPRHYQLPEVLPNGDIIIRRRPDAPPFQPKERDQPAEGETKT